jgi:hypothetical protein
MNMTRLRTAAAAAAALALVGGAWWVWRARSADERLAEPFLYRGTRRYLNTPAHWLRYRVTRRLETGFGRINALAVGEGDAILAAAGAQIIRMGEDGRVTARWTAGGDVRCLAAASGRVFAGVANRIEIRAADGEGVFPRIVFASNAVITAIAAGGPDLFVADAGNRIVYRCDPSGPVRGRIGAKAPGRDTGGFVVPSPYFDLALAPDGLLRVVNPGRHRIEAYTTAGDLEFAWGGGSPEIAGFCGCCNPSHIALLPDGGFVTSEKGLRRIKVYDPQGALRGVVRGTDALGEGPEPWAVAADSRGRIYAGGPESGVIERFEPAGE